jgi:hypothetical protein
VRGTIVAGAVSAVSQLWGAGALSDVSERLDDASRLALCDRIVLPIAWYPEASLQAWCEAVWEGPAQRSEGEFMRFVRRSVDASWSWVHRTVLRLATPALLARRAPDMWRRGHTHGELSATLERARGTVRITGYPYARSAVMRRGHTESLRHILTLARFGDVRATHAVEPNGVFVATFRWR